MRFLIYLSVLTAVVAPAVVAQVNTFNPNTPPNLLSQLSSCAVSGFSIERKSGCADFARSS